MQRRYLQDPLLGETLQQVKVWHGQLGQRFRGDDSVWTIVDGALLGLEGARLLQDAYGTPLRAFDDTALSAYEEFGLLIWPWVAMDAHDGLESMRTVMADRPGVSFVRIAAGRTGALGGVLAWLAGATTADDLPLYMRVGDTRVLSSFLRHMHWAQRAQLQATVREWVWPDREGRAQSMVIESESSLSGPESDLVLDDAQYAAMLDDAAADILHAALRPIESFWSDSRTGAQLHVWLQRVLQRTAALGITRQQDQLAFTSLALRVAGEFEATPELGETWLRVRSGAARLPDEVEQWSASQWAAVERFWHA
ncbi:MULTISPECIES: hypothetical protein [unclassified Variovorax]|jgi:hypothetical protein|uniref:hypothetical protein n=1 Tax=unclassified Variovorax TaxID=663243 RepID=UPI002B237917|nr:MULTISPECIES: hypothetical protein [unclassified Variovorax]MEB0058869.1 hypothetical protein [Variovorax sp. LG9.2]MEB0114064.1 hypothetical protein [Variovorax sp. RTB1]